MGMRRLFAGVAVFGVLVSGCGGPPQAGSAVIVGDDAVPLGQVQSALTAMLAKVPADQRQAGQDIAFARSIVTNDVLHSLLGRLGSTAGIAVSDTDIDTFLEQQGGAAALEQSTGLDADELRKESHDLLVAIALGRRVAPGLVVTADVVGATSREDAEAKARVLAAGGAASAALFANAGTAMRNQQFAALTFPLQSGSAAGGTRSVVLGTDVGDTVAYQPDPQQAAWSVFRVTQRRTDAVPQDPTALSKLGEAELLQIGQRTVQPLAESLGVRVNPRYGVWDPISLAVVQPDQTAGVILPAAG